MKLIVNDQLVAYSDEGSGDVVVLLHGWGADLRTFDSLAAGFKQTHRVIRLDFPGFGQSPRPKSDWHVDDYAQCVTAFLKKLQIIPKVVIGHSFGGRVIIKAVGNGYIQPEKVILMGSAGVKPHRSVQHAGYHIIAKVGKLIMKLPLLSKFQQSMRRRLYQLAGSNDYLESNELRPIFLNVINEDLQADAAKINQSSLLIWGENDESTPVSDGKILQSVMRASRLVVVPDAGHFVYVDAHDDVLNHIKEFIR